ncbi:MAG: hypothetical protein [Microvirus sp.]|nr:MAG: hypothetical protein [Microvirus sp.]
MSTLYDQLNGMLEHTERQIIITALDTQLLAVKRIQKKYPSDSPIYIHHTQLINSIKSIKDQINAS